MALLPTRTEELIISVRVPFGHSILSTKRILRGRLRRREIIVSGIHEVMVVMSVTVEPGFEIVVVIVFVIVCTTSGVENKVCVGIDTQSI